MTTEENTVLRLLADDRYNGVSIFTLTTIRKIDMATLRSLKAAGLVQPFARKYRQPAGLIVDCVRITEAGVQSLGEKRP
jgi:hypothetical protein